MEEELQLYIPAGQMMAAGQDACRKQNRDSDTGNGDTATLEAEAGVLWIWGYPGWRGETVLKNKTAG